MTRDGSPVFENRISGFVSTIRPIPTFDTLRQINQLILVGGVTALGSIAQTVFWAGWAGTAGSRSPSRFYVDDRVFMAEKKKC